MLVSSFLALGLFQRALRSDESTVSLLVYTNQVTFSRQGFCPSIGLVTQHQMGKCFWTEFSVETNETPLYIKNSHIVSFSIRGFERVYVLKGRL